MVAGRYQVGTLLQRLNETLHAELEGADEMLFAVDQLVEIAAGLVLDGVRRDGLLEIILNYHKIE